jgi:hypothetical protein
VNPNPTATVDTTSSSVTAKNSVFTLNFDEDLSDSALNAANYKLGGKVLPSNSKLVFDGDRRTVKITLPNGFVTVDGTYTLEVTNVTAKNGNTLTNGKASVQVATSENIKPYATSVTVADSKTLNVAFSEKLAAGTTATDNTVKVKVNGTLVTATAQATTDSNNLVIKLANNIQLTDAVSVEFAGTNLADSNGNTVNDAVISK